MITQILELISKNHDIKTDRDLEKFLNIGDRIVWHWRNNKKDFPITLINHIRSCKECFETISLDLILLNKSPQHALEEVNLMLNDPDFEPFSIMYALYKEAGRGVIHAGLETEVGIIKSLAGGIKERVSDAEKKNTGVDKKGASRR
jgi:hypothetical protein